MEKLKCSFCKKREVKQQEWKNGDEKKYCMTCLCFLRYSSGIEKAMNIQLQAIGVQDKKFFIEIRKQDSAEKLLEMIGESSGLKKFQK